MDIGKRIKTLRTKLGITQEELAKRVGYTSRSTINKIELGINDITQSKIVSLAKALNTSPAYLMGWENETEKTDIQMLYDNLNETNQLALLSYAEGLTIGQYGYIPVHTDKPPIELSKK